MWRTLLWLILAVAVAAPSLDAQVHVRGYYRRDGTYVRPHVRSSPNSTTLDNYSTRGNINPYTGEPGTRNPYPGYAAAPSGAQNTWKKEGQTAPALSALPWLTGVSTATIPRGEWAIGWTRRVGLQRRSAIVSLTVRDSVGDKGSAVLVVSSTYVYRMRRFLEAKHERGRQNGCTVSRAITALDLRPIRVNVRGHQERGYAGDARLAYEVVYSPERAATRIMDSHAMGALPIPNYNLPASVYDAETWPLLLLALSGTLQNPQRVAMYDHMDGVVTAVVYPIPVSVTTLGNQRRAVRGVGLYYPDVGVGASLYVDDVTGEPVGIFAGRERFIVADQTHPLARAVISSPCVVHQ